MDRGSIAVSGRGKRLVVEAASRRMPDVLIAGEVTVIRRHGPSAEVPKGNHEAVHLRPGHCRYLPPDKCRYPLRAAVNDWIMMKSIVGTSSQPTMSHVLASMQWPRQGCPIWTTP